MRYEINLKDYHASPVRSLGEDFAGVSKDGTTLSFNNFYLEKDGRPFIPVSGEFHYSRMDERRWEDELIKMRMGGVNIVSTYLFWNHIEEREGEFDFTGRRDLRRFVTLCQKHGLYVILRIGPFDHGEARNGGLPDWLYGKPFEVRHTNEGFMRHVRRLYDEIGRQVRGLFFRDGGPVIGVQLDNEYMHSSAAWEMTTGISNEWIFAGDEGEKYLLALREAALASGLTPAFFTATAWGGAAYSPRIMPLWGGYAYWPWIFYSHTGEHPATPGYVYEDYHHAGKRYADDFRPPYDPETRPYACCEMGGGMMCCYNYRFQLDYRSVDAMANVKLGSGCNFLGYYMFQGGTNPMGKGGAYLNEAQVPKRSYDYQAALGEFGQIRESYSRLKALHLFAACFGQRLAPMETVLPEGASQIDPNDLTTLRFAVRTDGQRGFLFVNNFQDHREMPAKVGDTVTLTTAEETIRFDLSLASGENAVLPFNFDMDGILLKRACAQPLLRTAAQGRALYVFLVPEGMEASFAFEEDARVMGEATLEKGRNAALFTVRKGETALDVLLLSRAMANRLFLLKNGGLVFTDGALLEDEKGGLRLETTRAENALYAWPADLLAGTAARRLADEDGLGAYRLETEARELTPAVEHPAPHRWIIRLPEDALAGVRDVRLQIDYRGDIGSLFLGNEMISDNFCNGATWEIGLADHRERLAGEALTLNIAPLRRDARVNAESAMAGRNEEAAALIADLKAVRLQPVYEIAL